MGLIPDLTEQPMAIDLAPETTSLGLLQSIYRSPAMPLPVRMRAAIEALPFEHPKLAVTATFSGSKDFAERLERAISRSGKVIEHQPPPQSEDVRFQR